MTPIEIPQALETRIRLDKAATETGFGNRVAEAAGWSSHLSWSIPGTLFLAAGSLRGPCLLALDRPAVAAAWTVPPAALPGPGTHRYLFPDFDTLTRALGTLRPLLLAIPDDPLTTYAARTAHLTGDTETVRQAKQRIGQDIFRARLLGDWNGRCPLTGITDPVLLRASHIIPWSACPTDAERLDPANGLLLSALWDAAFDAGLVTFDDHGAPVFSPSLSREARSSLQTTATLPLSDAHRHRLAYHRTHVYKAS